jgi:succinoglycan biosynthesis transport protein ExoP
MFEASRQIKSAFVGGGNLAVGQPPYSKIDFRKFWSAIWQGRMTIFITTAGMLVLALMFGALAPREYTAMTEILIDPSDLRAVGNETAAQSSDSALLQVESQVRVLTSDAVLRRVISSQSLDSDPEFVHGPSLIGALMGGGDAAPVDKTIAALNELNRHIRVKRADRTFVVDVNVTSRSPAKAARIANAIAEAYLAEQTDVRANAAKQVSRTLDARLKELEDDVRKAEDKVEAFKVRNNIVSANGQSVSDQQLSEVNNQLVAARARTAEAKSRLDQIEQVQRSKDLSGAFPEALQSQTITALRSQYAEIVRRQAEQMATLGPLHPAVIDIEAQVERLHRMIAEEINRTALSARSDYETAKADEQMLGGHLDTQKQTSVTNSQAMVGLRELERQVQASRTVYEAFLVRAREASAQEQLDTKNIHVLSKADPPLARSWPPPTSIMALAALFVGIASGTGIVLMRPAPLNGARRPPMEGRFRKMLGTFTGGLWPGSSEVEVIAILPATDASFGLAAMDDPRSPFTREIRKVYDELRANHVVAGNPSVLVLAADAEDDSATVALSLAAVAAATQRVLLIDADLECRTLSAIGAEDNEAGLIDVALGRRLLSDVTRLDRETNINLMAFVSPESRRDRRIYDTDIRRAFDQTRRYDVVIVAATDDDEPSLRFFAGLVDHIVLVARAGGSEQHAFEQIIARAGLDTKKIRGAVLTGAASA